MRARWMFPILLSMLGCAAAPPLTTVVIVRHAEKEKDGTKDPALTALGQVRAAQLAKMLHKTAPAAIFATQYRRTQDTVRPLAEQTSTALTTLDAGSTAALARRILSELEGETVVVAGHSNTVNTLIAELGGPKMADLDDTDYDNLFVVTIAGPQVKLLPLRVGLTPPKQTGEPQP